MDFAADIAVLRRRRNWRVFGTVLVLVGALGPALPRRIKRYRAPQEANEELLRLQGSLSSLQGRIRAAQTGILNLQNDIRRETAPRP